MGYPTNTNHPKRYPYTSIMATPYSADHTGTIDCVPGIAELIADQSNVGTIHVPAGTFKIGTDLTIPSGMMLRVEAGGSFVVAAGKTLTIQCPIDPYNAIGLFSGPGAVDIVGPTTYPAGTYTIANNTTISNDIRMEPGAKFLVTSGTLTFTGAIDTGPYQIFSWSGSGAIDLSACTTQTFYWENWGGIPGIANDASAALIKASESGIAGKTLMWGPYSMRIANPVQFTQTQGFTFEGMDSTKSNIYVDTGATHNGITAGVSGTSDDPGTDAGVYNYSFKNFMLIGPDDCCKNGIQLSRVIGGVVENVNAILGATGYAIVQAGTEHYTSHWRMSQESAYVDTVVPGGHAEAAGGLRLCQDGYGWAMNSYNKIVVEQTGAFLKSGAIALRMEGVGANIDISGNIEDTQGAGANLIYATDCQHINLHNIYTERTVDPSFLFERCSKITLDNIQAGGTLTDSVGDPVPYTQRVILRSCQAFKIIGGTYGLLRIEPSCSDTICVGIGLRELNALQDFGGNTTYIGGPYQDYSYAPMNQMAPFGENRDNYFTNTLLNRWQSDRPDGWNIDRSNTWTQCGTGKGDTTKHATDYCALIKTGGDTTSPTYTLSTTQLQAILGTSPTFTIWTNLPTGQSWSANDKNFVTMSVAVPDWTTGDKVEGYACNVSAGFLAAYKTAHGGTDYPGSQQWVCTTAGTVGASEPTWSATSHQSSTTTDGTVTWTAQNLGGSTIGNQPMTTAQSDGLWYKKAVSCFVPWNATAVNILIYLYRQVANAQASLYVAEPTLNIGATGSRGVLPGRMEFPNFIQAGSTRMYFGQTLIPTNSSSPLYTIYAAVGDIAWNIGITAGTSPGWVCTTAGLNNGGVAVWKTMPNVGA